MTDRELMQMVLDALESFESGTNGLYKGEFAEERKALRNRLAQPEPEPVAWMCEAIDFDVWKPAITWNKTNSVCSRNWKPLYTAPVHAIDISQKRVDEMAKRKHEEKNT